MKQSLFKILCLVYCLFIGTSVLAINVTIDNISYSLNISNRTASVTGSSLQNVVVPETINYDDIIYDVTAITASAFSSNTTIETFKSSSIKRIEDSQIGWDNSWNGDWREPIGTFARATNLSEVSLENVEFIGAGAFYQATSLTKVYVGNKLESIGSLAFGGCYNLKYIVIPSSISSIYTYSRWRASSSYASFYGCSNLIIICLSEGYDTGSASQTMYPSSFFNFGNNTFDYNGKVPEINYKFNGIGRGFQPTEIDKGEIDVNAGTHTVNLKCTFTNDDMSFYVEIPYEYTINPVTLKAIVNDASRLYGETDPQFSSTYSGFVNNEDASVVTSDGSYTTTAKVKSDVGTYAIRQTGATAQNYVFEYEDGTLTVNKAPLTMTANDKTMAYGDKVPTLDAKYEGLKNDETQPAWSSEPVFSTTATSISNVGTYPITISNAEAKNYQLTVNNGTMTIEKANLTVSADNKSRKYGEVNPEFTLLYTGLKNDEPLPEWEKLPIIETSADINSSVGKYPISVKNGVAKNYDVTVIEGTLTIEKAELQVMTNDVTRKYGEENPSFDLGYAGFVNNEDENVLVSKPKAMTEATAKSNVGTYDIVIDGGVAENYDFKYIAGKLTIEKAFQTLTWDQEFNDVIQYDLIELKASASSGLEVTYIVEGRQICSITKIGDMQYLDCTGEGETVIMAIQEGNDNYWQSSKIYKQIVIKTKPDVAIGDANGDGEIDDDDVNAISDYITTGNSDYLNLKNADINGDKVVNVADIVTLLNIIMASQTKPDGGGDNPTPVNPSDNDLETDKIIASFTGGAYSMINGKIQSGSKLNIKFSNNSSKSVTLTKIQLNDAETGAEGNNLLSEEFVVAAGQNVSYTITVGALGIYKPVISFTYRYNNKTYQVKDEWKEMNIEIPNIGF